jgi:hypothetical protein
VNTANNVNFGGSPCCIFFNISQNIFNAAFPGTFLSLVTAVRAKFTVIDTNIGGFDMKIAVKINEFAAQFFFLQLPLKRPAKPCRCFGTM